MESLEHVLARTEGEGSAGGGGRRPRRPILTPAGCLGAEGGTTPQAPEARSSSSSSLARCTRAWHRREQRWAWGNERTQPSYEEDSQWLVLR